MKQDKQTLTIGHFPIIDHLVLGVAAKNDGDYFDHLKLQTKLFYNWQDMCDALSEGNVDGAFMLSPLAMDLFREGVDIRAVLLGHREGQIMAVREGIKSPSDLRGKRVRVPHKYSVHYILLHQLLGQVGLSEKKDVFVTLGFENVQELASLLKDGKEDAFLSAEPWGTIAVRSGGGKVLSVSHDVHAHHICCIFVLRGDVIRRYPDACREMVESMVRAGMFMNAYPRKAAEVGEYFLGQPKKIILEAMTHNYGHVSFWDLLPRVEDFADLQRIGVEEMGLWDSEIDMSHFVYADFAQDAYRRWMIDTRIETKDKGGVRTLPGGLKDGVSQMKTRLGDFGAIGLRCIVPGSPYPKADDIQVEESWTLAFEKALSGDSVLIRTPSKDVKGIYLFPSRGNEEPDKVALVLSPEQADRCRAVLRFGDLSDEEDISGELSFEILVSQRPFEMCMYGKRVMLLLDHNVFRVLPVLLNLFSD